MIYFLDTEFIEHPYTIDLISVGIVAEDGRTFYRESSEVDWSQASPWVLENVKPHLLASAPKYPSAYFLMPRARIADDIRAFVGTDSRPEFWGYYADYDWVVFCWLFGTMMDLPEGWPKYCRDIKQLADDLGNPTLPEQTSAEHYALADALWTASAWDFLNRLTREFEEAATIRPQGTTA